LKISRLDPPPRPVAAEKINILRSKYIDLPEDYLSFLYEIGCGGFESFTLYSAPFSPNFFFRDNEKLDGLLLIGDDNQFHRIGFDPEDEFRLIEVDPRGTMRYRSEQSFTEFSNRKLRHLGAESPEDGPPPA